jgi:hypothetical protein
MTPSIVDDVVEVIVTTTIFPLSVVLSYLLTRVVIGQMPIAAGQ